MVSFFLFESKSLSFTSFCKVSLKIYPNKLAFYSLLIRSYIFIESTELKDLTKLPKLFPLIIFHLCTTFFIPDDAFLCYLEDTLSEEMERGDDDSAIVVTEDTNVSLNCYVENYVMENLVQSNE